MSIDLDESSQTFRRGPRTGEGSVGHHFEPHQIKVQKRTREGSDHNPPPSALYRGPVRALMTTLHRPMAFPDTGEGSNRVNLPHGDPLWTAEGSDRAVSASQGD